jgi:hypothetical protein
MPFSLDVQLGTFSTPGPGGCAPGLGKPHGPVYRKGSSKSQAILFTVKKQQNNKHIFVRKGRQGVSGDSSIDQKCKNI